MKHKLGLFTLFCTEMWERFSFYSMRGLLVLYLTASLAEGGLGWDTKEALSLYSTYMALVYLLPVFGGYAADKFLGKQRATLLGAVAMCLGHFLMAFTGDIPFYSALALLIVGNGLFKPSVTSILGEMYHDSSEADRSSAFSLFYLGINVGGTLAGFITGLLLGWAGFHSGFAAAGFGMALSLVIFSWGRTRYLGDAGKAPSKEEEHHAPLTDSEKRRMSVVGFYFLYTIVFFIGWEQLGGSLTLFIKNGVDLSIGNWQVPLIWLTSLNPFLIILLAPVLSALWKKLDSVGKDPSIGAKLGTAFLFIASAFFLITWMATQGSDGILPHFVWIILANVLIVLGELCFIPISWAATTLYTPTRYHSRMLGFLFLGISIGSYLAGYIGGLVEDIGPVMLYLILGSLQLSFGVICFLLNGWKKQFVKETHTECELGVI